MAKEILYGKDPEENIVSIEPLDRQNVCQIFKRVDGELESRYEPYEWLIYTTRDEPLLNKYEYLNTVKLFGSNHYDLLIKTKDYDTYIDFKYNAQDCEVPFEKSQYMLQTGKTLFKGMEQEDLLVLYFDIETLTTDGYDFPNAEREGDEITIISMRTSQGKECVLYQGLEVDGEPLDEKSLLKEFIARLREIDPDVLANHNIFGFDLPYIEKRCKRYGISFSIGRNGAEPVKFQTKIKFADRDRKYTNFNVFGRQVIDTQFLAEYADVTNRDMPSYRLKDLVKYLDKASENRVYIAGEDISDVWKNRHDKYTRQDLIDYALDDVREAEVLFNEWAGAYFKLTPMIPMNFQDVFRYGTGNEVEYVFMRKYLDMDWSYPKNTEDGSVPGGYADVLDFGLFKDEIMYIDVKSLYPSLAKMLKIQPEADELEIFQEILNLLINFRYEIKDKIKKFEDKGDKEAKKRQKALDASIKIFLNTMAYGFIASSWNAFADYDEASRITLNGQKEAKKIISLVEEDGGKVIKWDTDGGAIIIPDEYKGSEEKADEYCETLTERMAEGIIVENDGMYDGIIAFDGKSYALLEKDGTIKKNGASIISRRIEKFGRDYLDKCIKIIFNEDKETAKKRCKEKYLKLRERIENRDLEAKEISVRANLGMSPEEYKNRNMAGDTQTMAQYELALESDKKYGEGDVVYYYIKQYPYVMKTVYGKEQLRKKKCKVYEAAELIENYNYDIEPEHYLSRLDDIIMVFLVFGEDYFYEVYPNVKVYSKDRKKFEKKTGREWKTKNL